MIDHRQHPPALSLLSRVHHGRARVLRGGGSNSRASIPRPRFSLNQMQAYFSILHPTSRLRAYTQATACPSVARLQPFYRALFARRCSSQHQTFSPRQPSTPHDRPDAKLSSRTHWTRQSMAISCFCLDVSLLSAIVSRDTYLPALMHLNSRFGTYGRINWGKWTNMFAPFENTLMYTINRPQNQRLGRGAQTLLAQSQLLRPVAILAT